MVLSTFVTFQVLQYRQVTLHVMETTTTPRLLTHDIHVAAEVAALGKGTPSSISLLKAEAKSCRTSDRMEVHG